jgi:hypothetical protein
VAGSGFDRLVGTDLLQPTDENPEAGGVEELDALQVDHEVADARGRQFDDLVPRPRRGRDVDLAGDGNHVCREPTR